MLGWIRNLLWGIVAALLPADDARSFADKRGANLALASLLLGIAETCVGLALFMIGGTLWTMQALDLGVPVLMQNWHPGQTSLEYRGLGLISYLSWLLHPVAWFLLMLAITGWARLSAFAASGGSVGEPLVCLGLALYRRSQSAAAHAGERARRGPSRPERVVEGPGGITIISTDAHPEWTESVTLERAERFYRLVDCTEIQDGAWTALAYRFREADERDVIRALVHYGDGH